MTGKVALITGAGSGIGRAVAHSLAARGYRLMLAGRREQKLEETRDCLPVGDYQYLKTDVSDEGAVAELFTKLVDRFGRLDLLFNNAGLADFGMPLEDVSLADWSRVMNVNVTGAFLCLRAAFKLMKHQTPQGGRIINNGSVSAHAPRPDAIAYTASKHALLGITKSASLEGRRYNIACCQLDLGNISSAIGDDFSKGMLQADGGFRPEPVIDVRHAAEMVAHMDSLPLNANVQYATLMATAMPFVGRG